MTTDYGLATCTGPSKALCRPSESTTSPHKKCLPGLNRLIRDNEHCASCELYLVPARLMTSGVLLALLLIEMSGSSSSGRWLKRDREVPTASVGSTVSSYDAEVR